MTDGAPVVVVAETPPSPQLEAAASEAAVEIAAIQADRDVQIAEINAETTETVVQAAADADEEDIEWLRNELDGLRARCETQEGRLSALEMLTAGQAEALASMTETMALQAGLLATLAPPPPVEDPLTPPPPSEPPPPPAEPPAAATGSGPAKQVRKRTWL